MKCTAPVALLTLVMIGCEGGGLVIRSPGLLDVTPDDPMPRFLIRVEFENPGSRAVSLAGRPALHVRTIHTGGDVPVEMDPVGGASAPDAIAPGESREVTYDLWRLTNLYGRGVFPELRRSPEELRFRIVVETDAGEAESEEWSGVLRAPSQALAPDRAPL